MKQILLIALVLITLNINAQSLRAVADTFTVQQAGRDTFNVTLNDTIPLGDSACVTLLDSPAHFTLLNCHSIVYKPDSFFTGRDTCLYALCDTTGRCDTSIVIVFVDSVYALWKPIAGFLQDTSYNYYEVLFNCRSFPSYRWPWGAFNYKLYSTSLRSDSLLWRIRDVDAGSLLYDSTKYFNSDTITFVPFYLWDLYQCLCPAPLYLEVCLTAFNQFGSSTICDTTCILQYDGITEVPLLNIKLFPNPADKIITVDMRQNNDPISINYASVNLYNALGQRVQSSNKHNSNKMVEIPLLNIPCGIYFATIKDDKGIEMLLGKFTVAR